MKAGQKEAILSLVEQVEANNPLEAPTEHLEHCQGSWRLLYSTVTILVCSTALNCLLTDVVRHADFNILNIDMSGHSGCISSRSKMRAGMGLMYALGSAGPRGRFFVHITICLPGQKDKHARSLLDQSVSAACMKRLLSFCVWLPPYAKG